MDRFQFRGRRASSQSEGGLRRRQAMIGEFVPPRLFSLSITPVQGGPQMVLEKMTPVISPASDPSLLPQ
jgi:hypothetical protein